MTSTLQPSVKDSYLIWYGATLTVFITIVTKDKEGKRVFRLIIEKGTLLQWLCFETCTKKGYVTRSPLTL